MTQQREFSERAGWRTHAERVHSRTYRGYSAIVLAAGVLGSIALWSALPVHWGTHLALPGLLLTAGFFVAELCTTDVNVGRIDYTISLTAVPIVVGLLTLPFPVVLGAHLVAGLAMQLVRRAYAHMLYNAGVLCLEIVIPFAVLAAFTLAPGMPLWLVAVLAVLTSSLASTGLGLGALRVVGANLDRNQVASLGARTAVVELMVTMLGIAAYFMVEHTTAGWLFAILLAGATIALLYAYAQLLREQRDLGTLAKISLGVARRRSAGVDGTDPKWAEVTEQIRDQVGADRVVLHLVAGDTEAVRTVVAGRALPEPIRPDGIQPEEFWREDPLLQLPGTEVRYHQRADAAEEAAAALVARGAHEALVVALRSGSRLLGVVEAHDKASRWRGFARSDVRLLRTIANHLSTAADNQRLVARLRHDAYHDPQTGLLNRPGFLAAAGERIGSEPGLTVLRADLDVLSGVSDALGQAWGDRMVVTAGRRLRDALGAEVPLARIEGGQFALLLAETDGEPAGVAQRLRDTLTETYSFGRLSVEAEAYLGYARVTEQAGDEDDTTTLLQRADVALRTARGAGEPFREHSPTMGSVFLRRLQLVTQFRQAVERGELLTYYQPKVALPSRQLLGFEALVRWRHPEFGDLSPDEFVPAVEATGLIDVLTAFVTEQAIARVRAWMDDGLRMGVSVNLAVRSLSDDTLPDQVAEALARHGVPAELLTFELTESGVMATPERSLPVLRRLHALGVVLSLDDFGTGYSSLAYLRQLPVDEVKIDKSFVLGMGTDLGDLAVVRSIVELGHSLGLTVVAEGVEDDLCRDALLDMHCDVAQGYLISRPMPEEKLEAWMRARTLREPRGSEPAKLTLLS